MQSIAVLAFGVIVVAGEIIVMVKQEIGMGSKQ